MKHLICYPCWFEHAQLHKRPPRYRHSVNVGPCCWCSRITGSCLRLNWPVVPIACLGHGCGQGG